MKDLLRRIGGYVSMPVYFAVMFALAIAGLVVKALEKRRRRKAASRHNQGG